MSHSYRIAGVSYQGEGALVVFCTTCDEHIYDSEDALTLDELASVIAEHEGMLR